MASLNVIMNSDEDHQDTPRADHKKDKEPGSPAPGSRGYDHPSSNSALSSHVTRSGQLSVNNGNPSPPVTQGKRRPAASSRSSKASTTAPVSSRTAASRRRSTTSNDSMDQAGYASGASSSSMGGIGGGMNPNQPRRPMPNQPSGTDVPIKFTPITGRVSRAKKGIPVHTCDVCKKTFSRAEHLRRHQLSHNTPAFACNYPGCERTFFRADLLTRHQQKHEQEGDGASGRGSEDASRRTSSASASASLEERMPNLGLQSNLQPPHGFASNHSGLGGPPTPSTSASDITPTAGLQSPYQRVRSPRSGNMTTMSPQMGGSGDDYDAASGGRGSRGYGPGYTLSSSMPVMQPQPTDMGLDPVSPPHFSHVDYQPRNTPAIPLFLVTHGLPATNVSIGDGPPELCHTQDASPWTSASDSTYSTPSEVSRTQRYWMSRHRSPTATDWQNNNLLSPYPSSAQRDLHSPSGGLDALAAPYFTNPFPSSPHMASSQYHPYSAMLDVPMSTGFGEEGAHQALMDGSVQHSQHQLPTSSVRSPTPPSCIATSTQSTEALVTPPMALPSRMSLLGALGRQKEVVMASVDAMGGAGVFGMSGTGSDSPGWGNASPSPGPGFPGVGSGMGAGYIGGMTTAMPLTRAVRNAIPAYLDVYWERFHDLYPFVHRSTVETAGEDVLRCAMAAVATQYLNSKEDRVRGNQLHEFAWLEAKRYPQWNLQVMQAILLCELFARFRGKKAVIRPSKLFESLYSRVLYHNSSLFEAAAPAHPAATREGRWHAWVDAEARRRLLSACFVVNSHAAVYHEQPRPSEFGLTSPELHPLVPLTASSAALWAAGSAEDWAAILDANPAAGTPQFLSRPDSLTPGDIQARPRFDQMVILAAEAIHLSRRRQSRVAFDTSSVSRNAPMGSGGGVPERPQHVADDDSSSGPSEPLASLGAVTPRQAEERIAYLFPRDPIANAYLALHHTPLYDLLAVSGDSWVFSQKVVQQTAFQEHQKRVKLWTEGHNLYASTRGSPTSSSGGNGGRFSVSGGSTTQDDGMSATRATIYAARALVSFLARPRQQQPPSPSCISDYWALYACALICWASGHRAMRGNSDARSGSSAAEEESAALAWLRAVGDVPTSRSEEVLRIRGRREAGGVVGLVRRRLEAECVGGRSRLFVDAVGVLRKLEEGMNWKWF